MTDTGGLGNRRFNPAVWLLRLATAGMMVAAIVVGAHKFSTTPEQEELTRYATLTVPNYLGDVASLQTRFDRLTSPAPAAPDAGAFSPADARTLIVGELMPSLIRARSRAAQVQTSAASVRDSNDEYLAALDLMIEAGRAGVRAVDDPTLSGEAGYKLLRQKRREADDAVRAWMMHLRERCRKAGLKLRMTSRAALGRGLDMVIRERRTMGVTLACGATCALALHAGTAAAARVWALGDHAAAAVALWVLAGTIGVLIFAAGLSAVLSAATRNPAADPVTASLKRGVAMLSLEAVERFMGAMLALGVVIAWLQILALRHDGSPTRVAALMALVAAPLLLLALVAVPAFRVAMARAAEGEVSWLALCLALRDVWWRFPEVLRLLALGTIATAPLWLFVLALGRVVSSTHHEAIALACALMQGACGIAATAWLYASMLALTLRESV